VHKYNGTNAVCIIHIIPPSHKCEWCHKYLDHSRGKLQAYNSTGAVRICDFGLFLSESDLFVKSLTIFEKGPPTQPSLMLLTSNYCHPPYNCTTKVVFVGHTHWSVEIPLSYLCCVCCVVSCREICHLHVRDLLVRLFR
jgi:hypothetical protein